MIEGREQVIAFDVSIDLPGGIYPSLALAVTQLEIDASIDSDMPQGTRLEEGFSAVEGTFTLAGRVDPLDETKSAAWLFGRYPRKAADGSISPLYRQDLLMADVTISLGLYPAGAGGTPELLTKLVGKVEDYSVDGNGNVRFTVIDLRQAFRGTVDLPNVITTPPYNAGMTSEFLMDWILRRATDEQISSWPPRRPQCLLSAGLRTSLWPEIGTLLPGSGNAPTFSVGKWGSALSSGSALWQLAAPLADDVTLECALTAAADFTLLLAALLGPTITVESSGGDVTVTVRGFLFITDSYTFAGVLDGTPQYLGLRVHWPIGSTSWSASLRIDGTDYASGTRSSGDARAADDIVLASLVQSAGSFEAIQITAETTPTWNDAFAPRAHLDPSLNALAVIPPISGDQWRILQDLAAAELGIAGFEGDDFRFLNRDTLASSPVVRTITSDSALNALEEKSSAAAVVNRAQVGWAGWTLASTATTVWAAERVIRIPKGAGEWNGTFTVTDRFLSLDNTPTVLPNGSTDTANSHYRASLDRDGTAEHTGTLEFTIAQTRLDQLTVTILNLSSQDAYLVSPASYLDLPAGTPLLRVAGLALTQNDEQIADYQFPPISAGGAASSRFGEIAFQLNGNQWIQDEDSATRLASDIVIASWVPRADLVNVDIDPDPRLQRADRVHLTDTTNRTGVDEYALIFGYTISYTAPSEPGGNAAYSMTVDARTISAPGGWIGGVAGRSEGGITTYGY
jgi:hypothetical protein